MTDKEMLKIIKNIVVQACDLEPYKTETIGFYYEGVFAAMYGVLTADKEDAE